MALPGEEGQPSKAEGTNVFVRILVLLFVVACFGVGKGVLLGLIHGADPLAEPAVASFRPSSWVMAASAGRFAVTREARYTSGMTTETRSSLIHRVRDPADASGWREFDDLYRPLLLGFVRRRGLADADACDVVQDVFARLLQALPNFELDRSRGGFRSWLRRVALNAIADWGRHRKRQDRLAEEWAEQRAKEVAEPDAEWTAAYRQRIMEFALERVRESANPRTWSCFEQWLLNGGRPRRLPASWGSKPGSVRVNANRILEAVREKVRGLSGGASRWP